MPVAIISVVIGALALAVGALLGYTLKVRVGRGQVEAAERNATRILDEAQAKQRETLLEAKEEAIRLRGQVEAELKARRDESLRLEQRIASKEENLDRKLEAQERREHELTNVRQQLEQQQAQLEELHRRQIAEIERVAGLSVGEARQLLLHEIDEEVREEAGRRLRVLEAETREKAELRSREILT